MKNIFLFLLVLFKFSGIYATDPIVRVENKVASSGIHYTILYQDKLKISFETKRPDKNDASVCLCIAAAFTKLNDYTIDGACMRNGIIYNNNPVNYTLGGAIKIVDYKAEIFPTKKGKLINDSLIKLFASKRASMFQQIQMIENGKAASFIDKKLFQRRGIAIFKNGQTAIIESKEAITLAAFAKDLVAMNVKDFLYTDMGSWDEGWYRKDMKTIVTIGQNLTETKYQSNWIIFKK